VWLRRAGYRTIHVGKYMNHYPAGRKKEVPPGWSRWFGLVRNTGRMYRYTANENRRIRKYGKRKRHYMTDQLARTSVSELDRFLPKRRPVYLHFAVHAPHGEFLARTAPRNPRPAPRHLGRYGSLSLPRPPSFDEADVSDKPAFVRNLPRLSELDLSLLPRRYLGGIESLLAVDQAVRRIVGRLRKNRELRRTLIIVTSDNGLMLGEHRLRAKDVLYEEAVRVPLVIRGPGFPPGAMRSQLVSNVDLVPTILALTGARPGRTLDGRRLQPLAKNPGNGAARVLLLETRTAKAIRTPQYVYIEHETGERELYDMRDDPFQLQSLHDDPDFDRIEASLADRLDEIRDCRGATCP
jgi:arylsulfatase A-like enzyme